MCTCGGSTVHYRRKVQWKNVISVIVILLVVVAEVDEGLYKIKLSSTKV